VRRPDSAGELLDEISTGDGRLVYLSLGSLGSADVALMRRLVEVLARSPHRFIVSKGPQHEEYDLAANMWGAEFLPQPALMPLVDLVITHGGNNTTTECFHFGKPMIALPLFWDQYDNAQRIHESGFGARLSTYSFDDRELLDAIERLLADTALHSRLRATSTRVQQAAGRLRAASLLERLAATGQPVTR
jgi:UDP:flavonoid glycosyltransferase YjiC (YdhE family)